MPFIKTITFKVLQSTFLTKDVTFPNFKYEVTCYVFEYKIKGYALGSQNQLLLHFSNSENNYYSIFVKLLNYYCVIHIHLQIMETKIVKRIED